MRAIAQNQSLGARYFPYDALTAPSYVDMEALRMPDAIEVLEELAQRGRCLVAIPGEAKLALYYVDPDNGFSRLVWYEPTLALPAPRAQEPRSAADRDGEYGDEVVSVTVFRTAART